MESITKQLNYTIFLINNRLFAINVENVLKASLDTKIFPIPKDKEFVVGIINFSGSIVTIIDICKKFDLENISKKSETVLLLSYEKEEQVYQLGILIDKVINIKTVLNKDILNVPYLETKKENDLYLGTFKYKNEFVFVLDIDKIFF